MLISDTLNRIFIFTVLACDFLKDLLTEHISHEANILKLSRYLGEIPRMALMISRLKHLLLTLGMYEATCYVFSDYTIYIKRARFIMWPICIRVGVKYSTCTWYLYLSTYLSVLDVLEYLVYGNVKVLVLVLVLDQKVLGTYK